MRPYTGQFWLLIKYSVPRSTVFNRRKSEFRPEVFYEYKGMKRLFGLSVLSCALASGVLMYAVFLGQNAVAGSNGAVRTQTVQAPPGLRFAENERAAGKTDAAGKEAPTPLVDKETLSLYPTAAQCGQCHKQIYEEWSSSQHAYASISPMFHKFEQKFQLSLIHI